jgi:phosphoglycerol transferase MdoB-like AlkP superfamily enzyme
MSLTQYIPNPQSSYTWFFYLGILFFILHLFIYGFGLNLSYFGLVLIYIGVRKPVLSNWFRNILWVLIILDTYANITMIRDKIANRFFVTFDKNLKEGAKTKTSKKKSENENDEDEDEE